MNRTGLFLFIAVVILAGAAYWYYTTKMKAPEAGTDTMAPATDTTTPPAPGDSTTPPAAPADTTTPPAAPADTTTPPAPPADTTTPPATPPAH